MLICYLMSITRNNRIQQEGDCGSWYFIPLLGLCECLSLLLTDFIFCSLHYECHRNSTEWSQIKHILTDSADNAYKETDPSLCWSPKGDGRTIMELEENPSNILCKVAMEHLYITENKMCLLTPKYWHFWIIHLNTSGNWCKINGTLSRSALYICAREQEMFKPLILKLSLYKKASCGEIQQPYSVPFADQKYFRMGSLGTDVQYSDLCPT